MEFAGRSRRLPSWSVYSAVFVTFCVCLSKPKRRTSPVHATAHEAGLSQSFAIVLRDLVREEHPDRRDVVEQVRGVEQRRRDVWERIPPAVELEPLLGLFIIRRKVGSLGEPCDAGHRGVGTS